METGQKIQDTSEARVWMDNSDFRPTPERLDIRVIADDITELNVDGFVFYARPDLQLGSGTGGMIMRRGGSAIQKELSLLPTPKAVGDVVMTAAGKLKATFIVHAVGPAFQETAIEEKLRRVTRNILDIVETQKAKRIAIPPLGTGFYGIPLEMCARIMLDEILSFSKQPRHLEEIIICVRDSWEIPVFETYLAAENHGNRR